MWEISTPPRALLELTSPLAKFALRSARTEREGPAAPPLFCHHAADDLLQRAKPANHQTFARPAPPRPQRALLFTSKVELSPAIPAAASVTVVLFDSYVGGESPLVSLQRAWAVAAGVTVGCLVHDRFTGQSSISTILKRFTASAQKHSWLEQRIEVR